MKLSLKPGTRVLVKRPRPIVGDLGPVIGRCAVVVSASGAGTFDVRELVALDDVLTSHLLEELAS